LGFKSWKNAEKIQNPNGMKIIIFSICQREDMHQAMILTHLYIDINYKKKRKKKKKKKKKKKSNLGLVVGRACNRYSFASNFIN
jgi:hypothetical protein